jgi:hypothetical protein
LEKSVKSCQPPTSHGFQLRFLKCSQLPSCFCCVHTFHDILLPSNFDALRLRPKVRIITNLGPLTTIFTAPSDCSWISVNLLGSPTPTSTVFYDYKGNVWPNPLRCFPSGYPYANVDRYSGFYSPGKCPSAWTAWYPTSNFPDPAETTAYCCPPGFTVLRGGSDLYYTWFPCFTTHIPPYSASTPPALVISGEIDIVTRPYGDNTAGLVTDYNFSMPWTGWNVFGVQIRYRADDFGPGTIATPTSPNAAATTLTSAADTKNNNGVLSNGAKIGIWIGLPLFVITLGTIIAFILIRGRGR